MRTMPLDARDHPHAGGNGQRAAVRTAHARAAAEGKESAHRRVGAAGGGAEDASNAQYRGRWGNGAAAVRQAQPAQTPATQTARSQRGARGGAAATAAED